MDLRKVTAGQKLRIPVGTWNSLIDAAQDYQRRSLHRGGELARELRSTGIVLVKNTSGQDCFRYDVLGLDDAAVIIDPETNEREFCQRIVLPAVKPADQHKDSFCILQEPIKDGKFGPAMLIGVTQCWVDIKAESDTHAEPAADVMGNLVSAASGIARIVWKQAGTGIKLAIVRLGGGGGPSPWIAKVLEHNVGNCVASVRRQKLDAVHEKDENDKDLPFTINTAMCGLMQDADETDIIVYCPFAMDWTGNYVYVLPLDGNVGFMGLPILDFCQYDGAGEACTGQ